LVARLDGEIVEMQRARNEVNRPKSVVVEGIGPEVVYARRVPVAVDLGLHKV